MKDEIIIRQGGGPFSGVAESYKWAACGATVRNGGSNKRWLYCHHSYDGAPRVMSPGAASDETNVLRPISLGEARDLLQRFGLTEEDVPLVNVASMPPEALKEIASKKPNRDTTFHFYEVAEAYPYADQRPYLHEMGMRMLSTDNSIVVDATRGIMHKGHAVTKNKLGTMLVHQFLRELYGLPDITGMTFHPVFLKPEEKLIELERNPAWSSLDHQRQYITYRGEISEKELKIIERYVQVRRMTDV